MHWSEYHHTEDCWYNMDKLWATNNIDFIGIDAYFPLTKTEENNITKESIKHGWESGEYYDYYYDNNGIKQVAPVKINFIEPPEHKYIATDVNNKSKSILKLGCI